MMLIAIGVNWYVSVLRGFALSLRQMAMAIGMLKDQLT